MGPDSELCAHVAIHRVGFGVHGHALSEVDAAAHKHFGDDHVTYDVKDRIPFGYIQQKYKTKGRGGMWLEGRVGFLVTRKVPGSIPVSS